MEPRVEFQPGALVPFSGRGSTEEASALAQSWAAASNGLIQYVARRPLSSFAAMTGRPPYRVCALDGFRYPQAAMTNVDGKWYGPGNAPQPGRFR